jgi:hypothetical protein
MNKVGRVRAVAVLTIVSSVIPVVLQVPEPVRMALANGFSLRVLGVKLCWCQRWSIAFRSFPFEEGPSNDGSDSGEDNQGNGNVDCYPVQPALVRLLSWGLRYIAGINAERCHARLQTGDWNSGSQKDEGGELTSRRRWPRRTTETEDKKIEDIVAVGRKCRQLLELKITLESSRVERR